MVNLKKVLVLSFLGKCWSFFDAYIFLGSSNLLKGTSTVLDEWPKKGHSKNPNIGSFALKDFDSSFNVRHSVGPSEATN